MRTLATLPVVAIALLAGCRGTPAEYPYVETGDVLARPHIEPDHQVAYGEHARQFGHLRLPDGAGPHPVLIVIHGGCWKSGVGLRYLDSFCEALTDAGLATWNVEYRGMTRDRPGWPDLFLDVAGGVDALRDLARDYPLDLENVVIAGHSAGGHLALWAAGRHRISPTSEIHTADPLPVHGVVSIGGTGDLQSYRDQIKGMCTGDVVDHLMDGDPASVPDHYAAASPVQLLPFGVPQRMLAGQFDVFSPPPFNQLYAEIGRRLGDDSAFVVLDDAAHFEPVVPEHAAFESVRGQILAMYATE